MTHSIANPRESGIKTSSLRFALGQTRAQAYSPNPAVQATIVKLLSLDLPPIPVAPKQDPRKPRCYVVANKKIKSESGETIEVQYCPLIGVNGRLEPKPRFTGKNPSYLGRDGQAFICKHGEFQDRLPTQKELKVFFANPNTGIGTLGGHGGVAWIDIDAKNFATQEECDRAAHSIIDHANAHEGWIERTGSNGWRVAVAPEQKPNFTNFALIQAGQHVGEALFEGRFTVLAPSMHPNGNSYQRVSDGIPTVVSSLECCGVYPSREEVEDAGRAIARKLKKQTNPHYGRSTDPKGKPFDIRNFATYFEGYEERSNGWAYAQCPHHTLASSLTSFRLHLGSGAFKLWCGCSPKDVYQSGLHLAQSRGYQLPIKVEHKPFDPGITPAYQAYVEAEQECDRCEQAEVTECLRDRFSQLFEQVHKPKRRKQRERVAPIKAQVQTPLHYVRGCLPQYQLDMEMPIYLALHNGGMN